MEKSLILDDTEQDGNVPDIRREARRKVYRHLLCVLMLVVGSVGMPSGASALEVQISTPRENAALNETLGAASLLMTLQARKDIATQDVVAAARADYQRILTALYEQAYYAPVINITLDGREAAAVSPVAPLGDVRRAVIRVDPGPLFRFGELRVAPLAPRTELPEGFVPGQVAGVDLLKDAAEAGVDSWRAVGHAKATVGAQQITARHEQARINAAIMLEPGPLLRFGDLLVTGNEDVRTKRIKEIAGLPKGQIYSPKTLEQATERLRRSGAFSVATLREADEVGPGDTLDVTAQITEAPPRRFRFGAELSSLEGLGMSAMWMHRNVFGGAERFRLDGEVSGIGGDTGGIDYRLGARFERPATFHSDMDFYLEFEFEELDEAAFNATTFALETGITHYASEHREFSYGLGYRLSDTVDAFGARSYSILTLPLSAKYDYRDDPLNAKSGYFVEANTMPFVNLFGTEDGLRSKLDMRAYYSAGEQKRLTFAVRGQVGSLIGPNLAQAPADFLYYSGGGGTVRGQSYQSLGVTLGGGQETGGRSFLGLSGEVRVQTTDKLSLVGFYDTGYIGAEGFPDGSSGKWQSGAGLGIRYDTGIGPVRLDVAVPVDGPGSNSGFEIYVGIGQAF
ncbi:autotransporter assembly complex protein TamA [Roseovarius pelagicus]|uniref:Autotransporter assembly complex protein TamA n=1 Tax=Roseovarius pelagicus TaxID=2980108 RepID=A0ABY6DFR8_9RHOB|nr:autotransporter assembly complex family protein [Roseovarius pelagicus]UXX84989.1 autotransporter assembly complex protein TamA [Roseovarius pelagicus]